jgi:hypothetical protein
MRHWDIFRLALACGGIGFAAAIALGDVGWFADGRRKPALGSIVVTEYCASAAFSVGHGVSLAVIDRVRIDMIRWLADAERRCAREVPA